MFIICKKHLPNFYGGLAVSLLLCYKLKEDFIVVNFETGGQVHFICYNHFHRGPLYVVMTPTAEYSLRYLNCSWLPDWVCAFTNANYSWEYDCYEPVSPQPTSIDDVSYSGRRQCCLYQLLCVNKDSFTCHFIALMNNFGDWLTCVLWIKRSR